MECQDLTAAHIAYLSLKVDAIAKQLRLQETIAAFEAEDLDGIFDNDTEFTAKFRMYGMWRNKLLSRTRAYRTQNARTAI